VLLNIQWQIVHAYSGRKHVKKYGSKTLSKNDVATNTGRWSLSSMVK
jgi:hypothetical protein